jgi:transposase
MTAIAAIDADMRRMTRAFAAWRRLMTIPGVGQLTALAFVAAIDDPSRIRRSRDIGAYLGLVPRRCQSGEVDYTGGISKCGDRRVRTLLYEATNVMLTRYKGQLARYSPALNHRRNGHRALGLPEGDRKEPGCIECSDANRACLSRSSSSTKWPDQSGPC